eukprot:CAMPEP_0174932562 /NCGR_PEP_ID=MMETSP1355-20121228/36610_1 /TAXON_ID=464990 /ORGANISM="Hemiselmis tepida, Strain CCMP443" /LENGTH=576 /DNA_ID=CAMNT_0016178983 /DNA_START=44 /DNA_END=1774 /DNA_ORIENTATION=+
MAAKERKSSAAGMMEGERDTSMGGGDRRADSKPSNPFKMPSDEEIFSLRDDERARKEEERRRFLTLPVHEKTTWASRAGSTSKNVLHEDEDEALKDVDSKKKSKFGGLGSAADNAYRQERHREKENMTDFIEKKRQMFLVQMSLDTKRAEIRKLEEQAQQREEALRKSEQMLEEDSSRFELFLKMNDQKAVDAIRKAEAETKNKQDKVQEIKKLNAQIAAVKSEMAKYEESLEECQAYKRFMDELTPQEYVQEQREAHKAEVEEKRMARKAARASAREVEDRQTEEEFLSEMEALKNVKGKRPDPKVLQQRESEHQARLAQRAKEREREDREDERWDPDEGKPWECKMFFKRPQQLLDIFAALEERNLFLIQNSQETEEQLEELKQKLEVTKSKMDEETEQLQYQINTLKQSISLEEAKASALRERANPLKGQADEHDIELLLHQLNRRVGEVYEKCAFEPDSSLGTLMMLANIEAKLEEYLTSIEMMPQEEVEKAEKEKEKERRLRVREEKMASQKKQQEDRIKKSIERSKAPVQKKTGKPVMFRAAPLVKRRKDKGTTEERDSDEEDLREFLTE